MVKAEKGSILASVIGIGVILSLSAAGFLFLAANSRSEEDNAFRRAGCQYDAESGLMLGAGWLREHDSVYIATNQGWSDTALSPTQLDNGCIVTISIYDNSTTAKTKTVVSRAIKGSIAVKVSWEIGAADKNAKPTLTMTNWKKLPP